MELHLTATPHVHGLAALSIKFKYKIIIYYKTYNVSDEFILY